MKNVAKNTGIKVVTGIKAGGLGTQNHSRAGLKVRSAVKAAGLSTVNHNRTLA
jgi:hypothetical protein